MSFWIEQLLNGLGLAGPIMLIALCLTVLFSAMRAVNAAVGALLVGACLCGIWGAEHFGIAGLLVCTIGVAMLSGGLVEFLVLRPQRRRAPEREIASFAVTLGIAYLLSAFVNQITADQPAELPVNFLRIDKTVDIWGIHVYVLLISTFAISVVAAVILAWILRSTSIGRLYRASANDVTLAHSIGINANRVRWNAWVVSGLLLGVASVLTLVSVRSVGADSGDSYLLLPFAAIVAGGMGNVRGAVIASLFFGLASSVLTGAGLNSGYQNAAMFGLLFVALALRPQGILSAGARAREY